VAPLGATIASLRGHDSHSSSCLIVMPAGELLYRSSPAECVAENGSVLYGCIAPLDRVYCNLILARHAPGPHHPPRAAPNKPGQSKDGDIITCGTPPPLAVRVRAVRHNYRARKGDRIIGGCKTKWCCARRMGSTATMAIRGKRRHVQRLSSISLDEIIFTGGQRPTEPFPFTVETAYHSSHRPPPHDTRRT